MTSKGEGKEPGALRRLPSVDRLLQSEAVAALAAAHGHDLAVAAAREALAQARHTIMAGEPAPTPDALAALVGERLGAMLRPTLRPVINATGVIIHTNLGRAPVSEVARQAMEAAARGYSNLEYDLKAGERGSRYVHAEALLCRLTGAEAALVVNNNAAAVLLALTVLAAGREVVISRGQLVEIGGGFRIPEVLKQSGARLVEVGTTNRTHPRDYEAAIGESTALLLRVHASNFKQIGFVTQVPLAELVEIGRQHNLPVVDDLGSGTLLDTTAYGLAAEPTVQESVQAGATLTTFSGDKLLGGPQGGIIVGRREIVERLRRHPLTRALRVDKVTLAGLQATLLHYLRGEATQTIPVWRMIAAPLAAVEARAHRWTEVLAAASIPTSVIPGESTVGGGSLPGETLPTALVALAVPSPDGVAARLRAGDPPVVARIAGDKLLLDPRTVLPDEDDMLLEVLSRVR
ncbi:MAG: L-seryl-tRNA(Sec) selenium transferase [Anaerolineae bacterium]|nr:L-seryl-tRNA(Sec) selenium transferase [Anaerolineae bacterium]